MNMSLIEIHSIKNDWKEGEWELLKKIFSFEMENREILKTKFDWEEKRNTFNFKSLPENNMNW